MIYVLDASVAVRWLSGEPSHAAKEVMAMMVADPRRFAVPELFLFETYSVFKRISPDRPLFEDVIYPIIENGVARISMTRDIMNAAEKYVRLGLTGYDACYAGLAGELNARWLTFDAKAHAMIKDAGVSELLVD